MPVQIATIGAKQGHCNICGTFGELTEDHVPPKSCVRVGQTELQHISGLLGTVKEPRGKIRSANGVKFLTLCARCNNTLLGGKYDPAFAEFVNEFATRLQAQRASGYIPDRLIIEAQPQAVMRSVVGHIFANGLDGYQKGPQTEPIRDYLLDESLPLPHGLHIYYWAYPDNNQVLVKGAGRGKLTAEGLEPFTFSLMKFYPFAFMVIVGGPPHGTEYPMMQMEPWRNVPYSRRAALPVMLAPIPPIRWPEAPVDDWVLLYGQDAIHAQARKGKDRA